MANLMVVGSKECSTWNVTQVLKESPAFPVLWERRCEIANCLGVDAENIGKVNQESILSINTWSTSIHNLIKYWVADKGSKATLEILSNVLKENNLKGCAEFLLCHFLSKSSTDRRYKRIPTALSDFKSQEEKSILIFFTPDVFITCEKIRENGSKILSFENFLKILSNNCNQNLIVITSDFKELKTVLKQWSKNSAKLIIITGVEFKNEAENHIDETCHLAVDKMEWDELSPAFQHEIEEKAIKILRENFGFESKLDDDLENQLCGEVLVDLINNNSLRLFKPTLPPELPYYVKRELSTRNIISDAVLKVKDCSDIFVVSGMARSELSNLCKASTDYSTSQCVLQVPSVRFIMLDNNEHFQTLSQKCTQKKIPVHWLKNTDGNRLKWIRSEGNVKLMQTFMDYNQNNFNEEEFDSLANFSGPICISDSPGMGKSVLLAEVGRRLRKKKTVIFLSMCDFIMKVREYASSGKVEISEIKNALINLVCFNKLGKFMLNYQLYSQSKPCFEIILDGIDEVDTAYIKLSFKVLNVLKTIKSIRLWVSTRPHLLQDLENLFGVPGYTINPFRKENQQEFLFSYWSAGHSLNHKRLQVYIDKCLESIYSKLNSEHRNIVGIPLQCYMVGVIFENEAVDFCKSVASTILIAENGIDSNTNLYEKMIEAKFAKYAAMSNPIKSGLINTHVYYSLRLIFPQLSNQLNLENILDPLSLDLLLKVGILEMKSDNTEPNFIHRTFAEYFVANFVVNLLKKDIYAISKADAFKLANFIVNMVLKVQLKGNLLGENGLFDIFDFTNLTISYFFNSILSKELNNLKFPMSRDNWYYCWNALISLESLQAITRACILRDHFNIYNCLQKNGVFSKDVVGKVIFNKDLIYFAIQYANLAFIKSLFASYDCVWIRKNVNDKECQHVFNSNDETSALSIAIQRGKYEIVEYLVNERNFRDIIFKPNLTVKLGIPFHLDLLLLEYLIKFNKNSAKIKERLSIHAFLHSVNPLLISCKFFQKLKQRLFGLFLLNHIEHFIERIHEIYAESETDILMLALGIDSSTESYLNIAQKKYISLNLRSLNFIMHQITPLLKNLSMRREIRSILSVDNATNLFTGTYTCSGALLEAIVNLAKILTVSFVNNFEQGIEKLIKYGPEISCSSGAGETILHRAAYLGLHNVVQMLVESKRVDVNVKDADGLTPLDYAKKKGEKKTCKVLKRFGGISENFPEQAEEPEARGIKQLFIGLFR